MFRPCFGCHPTPPPDHLNSAGLLWRISGGKITAMQSDWATIEIDGVQRIIHRRPSPANFVLPWRRRSTARSPLTSVPPQVVAGMGAPAPAPGTAAAHRPPEARSPRAEAPTLRA